MVERRCFLAWLSDWEKEVKARKDLKANEKNKLILSRETLLGIRITSEVVIIVERIILCNQFQLTLSLNLSSIYLL